MILIGGGILIGVLLWQWQTAQAQDAEAGGVIGTDSPDWIQQIIDQFNSAAATVKNVGDSMTPYMIAKNMPGNAAYVAKITAVELANGIPAGMLVRLAWQESRFRDDIISGRVVSSAGAKGMFQLMPIHWKYVNPIDWEASADYAGAELARLYRVFGTWSQALAAYNWGEGNLKKYGIAAAPAETRNYYNQILADIGQGVTVA